MADIISNLVPICLTDVSGNVLTVTDPIQPTRVNPTFISFVDEDGFVLDGSGSQTGDRVTQFAYGVLVGNNGQVEEVGLTPNTTQYGGGIRFCCAEYPPIVSNPIYVCLTDSSGLTVGGVGSSFMQLGMGLAGISSFSGYYPFSNVLWNAGAWERESGSGAYTQSYGTLTAAVSTDVFYCKFAEAAGAVANLPAGTYTVLNPDGCEIGVGWFGTPNLSGYSTATSFTFDLPSGNPVLALYAKGSVTNIAGPIRIIMPGQLTAFNAGDPWNPEFITFISGLNMKSLRFMDWATTYQNTIEDWADQHTQSAITFRNKHNQLGYSTVPYDLFIDLCNRLNIDPWINLPTRLSNGFIDSLAAYFLANLNSNLRVYLEAPGNETWNFGAGFNDGRVWTELYTHTRYEAVSNVAINGWTKVAHGMATDEIVSQFFTADNFTITPNTMTYPLGYGEQLEVEVVDADNFRLRRVADNTTVTSTVNTPKLIYKRRSEPGKLISVDTNHGIVAKAMWDRWDAIFPRSRTTHVMASMFVTPASTTARLAPSGVTAATDAVAVALYYQGDWWVSCVDVASGQLTPKAWSRNSGGSVRVAVYASGSTPTLDEVMAGAGTGYIGHRDIAIASTDASSYTSASAITGLSNGTTYEIRSVLSGQYGFKWMASGTATVSASASTVAIYDSDENQARRARYEIKEFQLPLIYAQQAAAGSIPLVAYECGSDYFGGNLNASSLPEVYAWRTAWTQTSVAGEVFGNFYTTMAASGITLVNQFVDINAAPGVFNIAESFDDTSDPRYLKFSGYNGRISKGVIPSIANMNPADVATEPSYPSVVTTFADASLTYSVFNGDGGGNFTVVGDELRIINGNGINWAAPTGRTLTIEASNGVSTDYFTVSFSTGDAWYEADAQFAWDSIADNNNAEINPIIGGNLSLTGTASTIASGLWDFTEAGRYNSSTALSASMSANNPILLAAVLDKDNHTSGYRFIIYGGPAPFFTLYNNGGNVLVGRWNNGANIDQACAAANPTGKHVYWTYYDADPTTPKIHSGIDQTEFGTGTAANYAGVTFPREITIGGTSAANQSNMKHGSTQVVNRAGMTLSDALAIVQKMQTLHGI